MKTISFVLNPKSRLMIYLFVVFCCACFPVNNLEAGEYKITQLTDNNDEDKFSNFDNGGVIWRGHDGNDYEIFFHDGTKTIQLTDNNYDDSTFAVSNGQVAWSSYDGNDYEIFLYDGTQTIQLTDNNYDDIIPRIHNGQVAWMGYDGNDNEVFLYDGTQIRQLSDNVYGDVIYGIQNGQVLWMQVAPIPGHSDYLEIFLYNGTQTLQITENDQRDALFNPRLHNGQIAWRRQHYNGFSYDTDVFLYNGTNTVQITDDGLSKNGPTIYNGQIAWYTYDGNDEEIFLYNGTTIIQLTDNNYRDAPAIVNNGQVVWQGYDGNDYELFLYDGTQTIQLTDNNYDDNPPQIHNGQVAWQGYDGNDYEIFLYDGTQTIQLTDNNYDDIVPQIHNGQVAWQGYDGQDNEIYLAIPPLEIPPPDSLKPLVVPLDKMSMTKDPINIATGEMINHADDISIKGRGLALHVGRTYRSQSDVNGLFGHGWRSAYDINLTEDVDGNVTVFNEEGVAIYFYFLSDSSYLASLGNQSSLTKNSDGTFTLINKHGMITQFGANGRLSSIIDRNGNILTFVFDPANPNGTYLEDAGGRRVTLTLDANQRVINTVDPAGRVFTYDYDTSGDLVTITDSDGQTVNYHYDTNHNITQMSNPNMHDTYFAYDAQDRAIMNWQDGDVNKVTLDFVDATTTMVTDSLGNTTTNVFNDYGLEIFFTDALGITRTTTWDDQLNRFLNLTFKRNKPAYSAGIANGTCIRFSRNSIAVALNNDISAVIHILSNLAPFDRAQP